MRREYAGKPNKIYLYATIPEPGRDDPGDSENPPNEPPNSDPQNLSFQNRNSYGSKTVTFSGENRNFYGSESEVSTGQESQNFRLSPTPENTDFATPTGTNLSASNNENNKNEKNHTEGSNKNNRPLADNSTHLGQFAQFWAMYPRKEGKKAATDWWTKKKPDEATLWSPNPFRGRLKLFWFFAWQMSSLENIFGCVNEPLENFSKLFMGAIEIIFHNQSHLAVYFFEIKNFAPFNLLSGWAKFLTFTLLYKHPR